MAKRKGETYRIDFVGTGVKFEGVHVHVIPADELDRKYFHIDKKPNGWLMLVTEGFLHDHDGVLQPMEILRNEGGDKPSFLVRNGCACPVSHYTTLTSFNGKEFYHLDQLDTGSFRICHSIRMFPKDFVHTDVSHIQFTKEV